MIKEKFEPAQLKRNVVYLLLQPQLSNFPFEFMNTSFSSQKKIKIDANEQYFMRMPNFDVIGKVSLINSIFNQMTIIFAKLNFNLVSQNL